MSVSATGRLASEPKTVGLTDCGPRLVGQYGILWHLIDVLILVVLARKREVDTYIWAYIRRDEIDDFLRVSLVPYIYMYHPERVL